MSTSRRAAASLPSNLRMSCTWVFLCKRDYFMRLRCKQQPPDGAIGNGRAQRLAGHCTSMQTETSHSPHKTGCVIRERNSAVCWAINTAVITGQASNNGAKLRGKILAPCQAGGALFMRVIRLSNQGFLVSAAVCNEQLQGFQGAWRPLCVFQASTRVS